MGLIIVGGGDFHFKDCVFNLGFVELANLCNSPKISFDVGAMNLTVDAYADCVCFLCGCRICQGMSCFGISI